MATCTTKTSGATWVAARRCSAVISLSSATPELSPVASIHPAAAAQWCAPAASATNFVDSPLQANAAPAEIAATMPSTRRRRRSAYGASAMAARTPSAATSGQPPA
jgi:hypothetical protein